MHAHQLHVVTARVNPLRWSAPETIYKRFEEHMLDSGVTLTTVECQHGERAFIHDTGNHVRSNRVHHIGTRCSSMLWTKENLLNIGIRSRPDAKYIAWIDADVFFEQPNWATETLHALQLYHVVQPWKTCLDRGPNFEVMQTHVSFCHQFFHGYDCKPGTKWAWSGIGGPRFPHPGYAWAARREALDATSGLLEVGALGSGDAHMASGLIGYAAGTYSGLVSDNYKNAVLRWQEAAKAINHNIGYVNNTINHHYHGRKIDRHYNDRWDILVKNEFDPITDVRMNLYGVLELTGNKPQLQRDINHYFLVRNEDANTM